MGKHKGQPADEPGKDLIWGDHMDAQQKADNFDAYDAMVTHEPEDNNPYSKENFNK